MILDIVGLVGGLIVLTLSGDQFVAAVARLAEAWDMRPTVVGALVGGLGTSFPELIVSAVAVIRSAPQLAMGNLVGSIIANVSLGLALAALVAPIHVDSRTVRREAPLSLAGVVLFALVVQAGLSVPGAIVLSVALALAIAVLLKGARDGQGPDELGEDVVEFFGTVDRQHAGRDIARAVGSLVAMLVGAEVLIVSATHLAERVGLAEGFVGLTIVAVGSSMPRIASGIAAARRGDHDLVVGNILGGNLFIALLGGALVGFLGIGIGSSVAVLSLIVMVLVTSCSWAFMARGGVVTRWEAALLLVAYLGMLPFLSR